MLLLFYIVFREPRFFARDLLQKINCRVSKLNNVVLILIQPLHRKEEGQAHKRISCVNYNEYQRIHNEATEFEIIILNKFQEGEIIEGDLKVEEIEVVYRLAGYVPVSVENRSQNVAEANIRGKSDKEIADASLCETGEDAKSHAKRGDDKHVGVLDRKSVV